MSEIWSLTMKQYVTRKRRIGEEIDYSDGFDEYIGREHTGRIVKFVNGEVVNYFSDGINPLVDNAVEVQESPTKTEVQCKESKFFRVIVNHSCGTNEFISDSIIDIEEYTSQLNSFYWEGFVTSIKIEGL